MGSKIPKSHGMFSCTQKIFRQFFAIYGASTARRMRKERDNNQNCHVKEQEVAEGGFATNDATYVRMEVLNWF